MFVPIDRKACPTPSISSTAGVRARQAWSVKSSGKSSVHPAFWILVAAILLIIFILILASTCPPPEAQPAGPGSGQTPVASESPASGDEGGGNGENAGNGDKGVGAGSEGAGEGSASGEAVADSDAGGTGKTGTESGAASAPLGDAAASAGGGGDSATGEEASGEGAEGPAEGLPRRAPPLAKPEESKRQKIFFEGRWIEGAVQQRRAELLARRAYAEFESHLRATRGDTARPANFDAESTTVTTLDSENSFVVIAAIQGPDGQPVTLMAEVRRAADGSWSVAKCHEVK